MAATPASVLAINVGSSSIKFALYPAVRVMPTDEELMIARSVSRVLAFNPSTTERDV